MKCTPKRHAGGSQEKRILLRLSGLWVVGSRRAPLSIETAKGLQKDEDGKIWKVI